MPDTAISIIDADSDLADLLDDSEVEEARRQTVTGLRALAPGPWEAADAFEADHHHQGFLIADGLLSREVEVLGRSCVELLGPGDVLRPWQWDPDGSHVHAEVGWEVLEPARLAVLDHAPGQRVAPYPPPGAQLFCRGIPPAHAAVRAPAASPHQPLPRRPRPT